jgi:hypothetical protein
VTCGVCGEAVDALGLPSTGGDEPGAHERPARRPGNDRGQALFIVARGHPELLDQLRVVMGHETDVAIIEDRRQHPRDEGAQESARELRRRLRDAEPPDETSAG